MPSSLIGKRIASVVALVLAIGGGHARGDVLVRNPTETDDGFMARAVGSSSDDLAQKVVRSTEIAGGKVTLIGFVIGKDDILNGHLLIGTAPGHYEHVTFSSCEPEGAAPELLAVFFARTVKGGGRDLGVLCRWEEQHAVANGMLYSAQFYRVENRGTKIVVEPVTDLNKKFQTDEMVRLNEHEKWVPGPKAKFTTVAQVKKLLTKMGIKQ